MYLDVNFDDPRFAGDIYFDLRTGHFSTSKYCTFNVKSSKPKIDFPSQGGGYDASC